MKSQKIVLLGGTGFVGRHLVPRLVRDGHQIIILSRNRERHRDLAVWPGVRLVSTDVHDAARLGAHLAGVDAAINLVGILNEPRDDGRGFHRAHVELTETLVAACQHAGVPRLLQMSALGAGEGRSHYLKSRGAAEARVRASPLAWTLFRPSVIFGRGDGLFFRFAGALFQPVYAGDVAEAFARALVHPHTIGRSYELGGPRTIALGELVRWTARLLGKRRLVIGLPDALGWMQAWAGEWLPGKPITRDNFRSLGRDSVARDNGLGALGIVATPMEAVMPGLLAPQTRARRRR